MAEPDMEPLAATRPHLWALVLRARAETARLTAIAQSLAAIGKPVRMTGRGDWRALAGPDMSEPGMFRLTRFDARGPVGHTQHRTLEAAIMDGLQSGYTPTEETP